MMRKKEKGMIRIHILNAYISYIIWRGGSCFSYDRIDLDRFV